MVGFCVVHCLRRVSVLLAACLLLFASANLLAQGIVPFYTFNQSPIIQIYGLPAVDRATVLAGGEKNYQLITDRANNFSGKRLSDEEVFFDGETQRVVFAFQQGLSNGLEWGVDIPWLSHSGGRLDSFIEFWHRLTGLSQNGRDKYPRNRLLYNYQRSGNTKLNVTASGAGIGDIRLKGAWQVQKANLKTKNNIAFRALLSLPTGDSGKLFGSGAVNAAFWFSADRANKWFGYAGSIWGGAGMLLLDKSDVLPEQQRNTVLFGSIGSGARISQVITLKLQLDMHSSFYKKSHLKQINANAVQLVMGGNISLTKKSSLDLAIKEDLSINASPDVVFHIGLSVQN